MQAEVWILPDTQKILVTDLVDIMPLEILCRLMIESPEALAFCPDFVSEYHLGQFATRQAAQDAACLKAQETGYELVEESVLASFEPNPDLVVEVLWPWEEERWA
jgi:hypothetical protein